MKRILIVALLSAGLTLAMAATARASQVFTTSSPGVDYSVTQGSGFYVSSSQINDPGASAGISGGNFALSANTSLGGGDTGIVLYFNGGLTLGQLTGVTINNYTASNNLLSANLWLDTGGDGKFFSFDSNGLLTGLNGDSYALGPAESGTQYTVDESSMFFVTAGDVGAYNYTLAQLQAGDDPGINASTPVALWIGQNGTTGPAYTASFASVDVLTTPEPISMIFFGTGLVGVCGFVARRRMSRKA